MRIRVGVPLVLGVALALGSWVARPDMGPEEELFGDAISASVAIGGVGQFPGHVFYLFPLRCSRALVELGDEGGADLGLEDLKVVDGVDDQANFAVLQDGPIGDWIGSGAPCQASSVYALDRDVAAGIDLSRQTLAEQQAFFAEDPRLFRTDFAFVDHPPYASTGSPLRSVHEEIRVLRIDAEALVLVLDQATYRFADGTEQTLKLAHTKRPELPFRPLRPAKLAKYASSFAKWEERHAGDPPPAPKLPPGAQERLAELMAERAAEAAEDGAEAGGVKETAEATAKETAEKGATETGGATGETGAGTGGVAPREEAVVAVPGVAAPGVAVVATPVVAPVVAVPVVAAEIGDDDEVDEVDEGDEADDEVEVAGASEPLLRRVWPLMIALVVGVGAAIALRRRRPGA